MSQEQDIESLRQKKAEKLQQKQEEQQMLRKALVQILEPAAYERLMIVKSQNPQLYANAVRLIVSMAQQGRLVEVSEESLKALLLKLSESSRRETKIEIRRKGE